MQANKRTLGDILAADIRLVAPLFQRPYVWNQDENWEPLWRAVEEVTSRRLAGHSPHPYFMGAIVLANLKGPIGTVPTREIIDGQQRMTTLQILMESAKSLCEDAHELTRLLDRVTRNILGGGTDNQFKVWPTNIDRESFRSAMAGTSVKGKLHDARIFFTNQIREYIGQAEDRISRLSALVNSLISDFVFVAIDLDNDDDGQLIFETLNSLGAPLLPSDLVKNLLFRDAQAKELDTDGLYEAYWKQFEKEGGYWQSEVEVGRRKRSRLDLFLQHYLVYHLGRESQAAHQFRDYRENFQRGHFGTVPEALKNFSDLAQVYKEFDEATGQDQLGLLRQFLRDADLTVPIPLVLGILANGTDDQGRDAMLSITESYLVRRFLGGSKAQNLSRIIPDLVSKLHAAGWTPTQLRHELLNLSGQSTQWYGDEHIHWRMAHRSMYFEIRTAVLGHIFSRVENDLRNLMSEEPFRIGAPVQIEHIMPRSWEQHWPLSEDDGPEAAMTRNELVHRIGNLTILTSRLNLSVTNAAWSEKKGKLRCESVLKLNQRLAMEPEWSEETIRSRSAELAETFCRLWPR